MKTQLRITPIKLDIANNIDKHMNGRGFFNIVEASRAKYTLAKEAVRLKDGTPITRDLECERHLSSFV